MKSTLASGVAAFAACAAIVIAAFSPVAASAAVPTSVPYVGLLSHAAGAPFNGSVSVVAAIYDTATPDPDADAPIWGPHDYGAVPVSQGLLAFVLGGDGSPLLSPEVVGGSGSLWVLVTVDGVAMAPAQRIHSVPFALRAQEAAIAQQVGDIPASQVATQADLATVQSAAADLSQCREVRNTVVLRDGLPGCNKGNYGLCVSSFHCQAHEHLFVYSLEPYSRHWWGGYVDSFGASRLGDTGIQVSVGSNSFWMSPGGGCAYAPQDCGNVTAVMICCPK